MPGPAGDAYRHCGCTHFAWSDSITSSLEWSWPQYILFQIATAVRQPCWRYHCTKYPSREVILVLWHSAARPCPASRGHHRQPGSARGAEDSGTCNSIPAGHPSRQPVLSCRRGRPDGRAVMPSTSAALPAGDQTQPGWDAVHWCSLACCGCTSSLPQSSNASAPCPGASAGPPAGPPRPIHSAGASSCSHRLTSCYSVSSIVELASMGPAWTWGCHYASAQAQL